MTFSIDGTPVHSEYVEGDGNYNYSHGDNITRVKSDGRRPSISACPGRSWRITRIRSPSSMPTAGRSCSSTT